MRKDVRILLVGDGKIVCIISDQVGKSSLITSLITDSFSNTVPSVIPEVTIPPEVTPEKVVTLIKARQERRNELEQEIRRAHVICIVYAVDNRQTFSRISTFWIPYIKRLGVSVPIILVGNKIDCRGNDISNNNLEDDIIPVMDEFKEVETCVECSAKTLTNISEVFYFAQKAVLHPTSPLYDSREHVLKPACVEALKRIFKLCDVNRDGVLDDEELNNFQRKCFKIPLQQQELEGVKDVIKENEPSGVNENGLTEAGFLFLHRLFIQRGRVETTWAVLRQYGYGDDLSLTLEFLYPEIEIPPDCTVELSSQGYQFFAEVFAKFDRDKDGALNSQELEELFNSTSPGNPWIAQNFPDTTVTNESGSITLQGFLAQWAMTTLLDYRTTLSYFGYLGFTGESSLTGIKVMRSKKIDRKKRKTSRTTFSCYVFGAVGSGKTALLRNFIGKKFSPVYSTTNYPYCVVNSVEADGAEKYMVMHEVGPSHDKEVLLSKKFKDNCDVACFLYDSSDPNSFEYVAKLRKQFDFEDIPSLFIMTKSDLDRAQQPDLFCDQLKIAPPISISTKDNNIADLYFLLLRMCLQPHQFIPSVRKQRELNDFLAKLIIASSVGTVAAISGFLLYRYLKK